MFCSVCGSQKSTPLWPELQIVKCQCGHIYYNETLSKEQLSALYTDKYFKGEEYSNYLADKEVIQKNFANRLSLLTKLQPHGKLLEIGSAYGFFLDLAQKNYKVEGFEICEEAAKHASSNLNLNVHCKDFLEATIENDKDIVCLFDCIEHLAHPELFIQKIATTLKDNGKLMITTGDIGKIIPRIRGKKWRLIHPPTHIHYFSFDSLAVLLRKNGFKIIHRGYPGIYRSFNQLATSIFKSKEPVKSLSGYFWLNTFDIMEVVAVKCKSF